MSQALAAEAVEQLLASHYVGYLACSLNDQPYVVPITYYYDAADSSIIGYTAEGHKINVLRQNPRVSVIVADIQDLSHWQSAMIEGRFEEMKGTDAMHAIQLLITKLETLINQEGKQKVDQIRDMARASEQTDKVIYRIRIENKSGRIDQGDVKLDI